MSYHRFRQELNDFVTYFLMPLPALLLPWRIAYRWYDYLAGKPWLFEQRVQAACQNAQRLLTIEDMASWKRQHRLTLIIDHTDFWISWLQPGRAGRLLQATGAWPKHRPYVVVGMHYGCGFMLMRALQRAGVDPYFILRKTPSQLFKGQRVRQFYVYLRLRHQKKMFPGKCYHPGTYPRRLLRGLDQQNNILVLVDVPADQGRPVQTIELFGQQAYIDRGMFDFLVRRKLRYVTYRTALNFATGQRTLTIFSACQQDSGSCFWAQMNQFINQTLAQDSSQWHLWQVASLYYVEHKTNHKPTGSKPHIQQHKFAPARSVQVPQSSKSVTAKVTADKDIRSPDFMIIGAQKCGTSWLHQCLRQHQDIYLPEDKDPPIYLNSKDDLIKIQTRMAAAGAGQLCGDANAAYFWAPNTIGEPPWYNIDIAAAVKKYFGNDIKLVILLRDPVQRVISAYLHHVGMQSMDPDKSVLEAPDELGLIDHSRYGNNLHYWRNAYPDDNLLILPAPDKGNHHKVLNLALDFLGLGNADDIACVSKPVFPGLHRFQDSAGIWVNLSHPAFKARHWRRKVETRMIKNASYALLIEADEIRYLVDLLTADTDILQQELISDWNHPEFHNWSTWHNNTNRN